MAFTDPDGNHPLAWIIAGAILIGKWYHDGRKANGGEANPLDWDWKNANFVLGVSAGGAGNGFFGGLGWNNNYGVAMGVNNGELNLGYISNGTPVLAPLRDKVSEGWNIAEKQIEMAFNTTNEYVSQVDWGGVGQSALNYTGNTISYISDYCDVNEITRNKFLKWGTNATTVYNGLQIVQGTPSKPYIETVKDSGLLYITLSHPEVGLLMPIIQTYGKATDYIIDIYYKGEEYLKDLVSFKIYP